MSRISVFPQLTFPSIQDLRECLFSEGNEKHHHTSKVFSSTSGSGEGQNGYIVEESWKSRNEFQCQGGRSYRIKGRDGIMKMCRESWKFISDVYENVRTYRDDLKFEVVLFL